MIPLVMLALTLHLCAVMPIAVEIGLHDDTHKRYQWVCAIEPGNGREEHEWKEGTWPRHLPIVACDSILMMVGERKTWISGDGIIWNARDHDGGFGKRYGSALVRWSGKFWIMGGMKTWDDFRNDIWSSEDGLQWTLERTNAPWSPRRGHAVLQHQGRLWLIGGAESSGKPNVLPNRSLDDVWVSDDGISWECVLSSSGWSATFPKSYLSTASVVQTFRNCLWVLGTPGTNAIWSSSDGATWVRHSDPEWSRREGRISVVFDDHLWVLGGNKRNDVWYSDDGIRWTLLSEQAPWSRRSPWDALVFHNRLWIYGGKTGNPNDRGDDVWFLERTPKTTRSGLR